MCAWGPSMVLNIVLPPPGISLHKLPRQARVNQGDGCHLLVPPSVCGQTNARRKQHTQEPSLPFGCLPSLPFHGALSASQLLKWVAVWSSAMYMYNACMILHEVPPVFSNALKMQPFCLYSHPIFFSFLARHYLFFLCKLCQCPRKQFLRVGWNKQCGKMNAGHKH